MGILVAKNLILPGRKLVLWLKTILLILALPLGAWSGSVHQVVAQIALNQLSKAEQARIQAVMGDLLEIAPEPDGYREISKILAGWHYIDYPWVSEPVSQAIDLVSPKNNIVWALKESKRVIKKSLKGHKKRFPEFERIFKTNFVHLMGDLHQPLHCISRVTEKHPSGDQGGNLFDVFWKQKKIRLHLLWDIGFDTLDSLTQAQIQALAQEIAQEIPPEEIKGSFEEWSKESYNYARTQVYQAVEGQPVSPEYVEKSKKLIRKRLAQAGYRLAKELKEIIL